VGIQEYEQFYQSVISLFFSSLNLFPSNSKRVFLLGPSHHFYLNGCGLPSVSAYDTPFGQIPLDMDVMARLRKTGAFVEIRKDVDEDEHSLEMHLPFIFHVMKGFE